MTADEKVFISCSHTTAVQFVLQQGRTNFGTKLGMGLIAAPPTSLNDLVERTVEGTEPPSRFT